MRVRPSFLCAGAVAAVVGACEGNRALGPVDISAGSGGAGETGTTGVTGTAGTTGTASTTGTAGTTVPAALAPLGISGVEAVERIASVLWTSAPDGDVLTQAQQGRFMTASDLGPAIQQMLNDPRATAGVGAFYRWWLWLDDIPMHGVDPTLFPTVTSDLKNDVARETETFGVKVTLTLNDSFQTLMTAPFSFVNARLADVYGLSGITGDDLQQVTLPQGRPGLLTRTAFLMETSTDTRTSVVFRGRFVGLNLFCSPIPAPLPEEPPFPQPLPPGITESAAMQMLLDRSTSTDPAAQPCHSCHDLMDPIGEAFEGFDPIGRARTVDNGAPIDTSLVVVALSTPPGAVVHDVSGLVNLLANDPGAERCMAEKWLSFAVRRDLRPSDDPSVDQIVSAFAAAKFNLQALITAVLVSPAFLAPDTTADASAPPGP